MGFTDTTLQRRFPTFWDATEEPLSRLQLLPDREQVEAHKRVRAIRIARARATAVSDVFVIPRRGGTPSAFPRVNPMRIVQQDQGEPPCPATRKEYVRLERSVFVPCWHGLLGLLV